MKGKIKEKVLKKLVKIRDGKIREAISKHYRIDRTLNYFEKIAIDLTIQEIAKQIRDDLLSKTMLVWHTYFGEKSKGKAWILTYTQIDDYFKKKWLK